MKFSVLGSGSSGNTTFVEADNFRFLIDAGFSCKQIEERLNNINIDPSTIGTLIITHEHGDHILGVGPFARKYKIPIMITKASYRAAAKKIGNIKDISYIVGKFSIGNGIQLIPYRLIHDAKLTLGFSIIHNNKKLSMATDIGHVTDNVIKNFIKSDAMIVETNYDYSKLTKGSYPRELINRVKGRSGHLSNIEASRFIKKVYSNDVQRIYLAHISHDNNSYNLAYNTVNEYLQSNGIQANLLVSTQEKPTKVYNIN